MGLDKVTQLRQERQRIKEIETRLKEEKQARFAELARRKELNKKREEENARRGEVVQVVSRTRSILSAHFFKLVTLLDSQPQQDQEDEEEAVEADPKARHDWNVNRLPITLTL